MPLWWVLPGVPRDAAVLREAAWLRARAAVVVRAEDLLLTERDQPRRHTLNLGHGTAGFVLAGFESPACIIFPLLLCFLER